MKRFVFSLFLIFNFSFIFAQNSHSNYDIIILLDNSQRTRPYYEQIDKSVLTKLCQTYLKTNDTFHLITFSSVCGTEISKNIKDSTDIASLISEFNFIYPTGKYSDFFSCFQYLKTYISSLDVYKKKKVIIISDGIFACPQNSYFYETDSTALEAKLNSQIKKMKSENVDFYYFYLPFCTDYNLKNINGKTTFLAERNTKISKAKFNGLAKKGKINPFENGHETFYEYKNSLLKNENIKNESLILKNGNFNSDVIKNNFSLFSASIKKDLGRTKRTFFLPIKLKTNENIKGKISLEKVFINGQNVLEKPVFFKIGHKKIIKAKITLPQTIENGRQDFNAELVFSNDVRTQNQFIPFSAKVAKQNKAGKFFSSFFKIIFIIVLIVAIFAISFYAISNKSKLKKQENKVINKKLSDIQFENTKIDDVAQKTKNFVTKTLPNATLEAKDKFKNFNKLSSEEKKEKVLSKMQKCKIFFENNVPQFYEKSKENCIKFCGVIKNQSIKLYTKAKNSKLFEKAKSSFDKLFGKFFKH